MDCGKQGICSGDEATCTGLDIGIDFLIRTFGGRLAGCWWEVGGKVNTSHFAMTPCGKQGLCSGDEASCGRLLFVGRVPGKFL